MRNVTSSRHQRGAIFVEAVIVCSMLMIMLAGSIFFHHMYAAKIRAVREARLAAWQAAEEGCASLIGVGQLINLISIDSCDDESCSVGGLGTDSEDAPGWIALGAKLGDAAYTVTADVRAGGQTHSMEAHNRVICNEMRRGTRSDLLSIGDYILDAVVP